MPDNLRNVPEAAALLELVEDHASFFWTDTFRAEFPAHAATFLNGIAELLPEWRRSPYHAGEVVEDV